MRNPKAEIRRPKEIQTPNAESPCFQGFMENTSDFWNWGDEAGVDPMVMRENYPPNRPLEDLGERTARFAEDIIKFARRIPQNPVNNRLISQLVGAASSIGANYCEADDGVTNKDFKNKIGTCKKEARESKFFLRMVATAEPGLKPEARVLWQEAKELHLIFCA